MTIEKLEQATSLKKRITELESLIFSAENHSCDWIMFTFGNGSSRESVCNDGAIIGRVRAMIIHENKQKLEKLKAEFDEL